MKSTPAAVPFILASAAGACLAQGAPPPGHALSFAGGTVSVPGMLQGSLGTSATVEFWMRAQSDGAEQRVIELGDGASCDSSRVFDVGLNPQWMTGTGNLTPWWFFAPGCTEVHKAAAWAVGEWTHVAAVIDSVAAVQRLYINGELVEVAPLPGDLTARALGTTQAPLSIGGSATGGLRYSGELDEVRIWSSPRSREQILQSMSGNASGPGLVAHYRFDEGQGVSVHDSSGNGRDGSISGDVSWSAVVHPACTDPRSTGRSLALDGTAGFVSVEDNASLDFDQQMTVEAWINMDRLSGNPSIASKVVCKSDGANYNTDRAFDLGVSDTGRVSAEFFGGTVESYVLVNSAGTLQTGRWYHLAATLDGIAGVARLFIDGEPVGETTLSVGETSFAGMHLTNSSRPLEIGTTSAVTWSPTPFFPGRIDEVRLWNFARTPQQIAGTFACEISDSAPGLVARYAFDQDVGALTLNSAGSGMNGVLSGGAASVPNTPVCLADLGAQGGFTGHDGLLDNNDFVAFISLFFNRDTLADCGGTGGVAAPDGHWDNNDFVVFVDRFFAGC